MTKPIALLLSCEHAVNTVPDKYIDLFNGQENVLHTHRGIDFGALDIATHLHETFRCDFTQARVSRLLIDCNRSLGHAHCFSEFTKHLSSKDKQDLINEYYLPFRQQTEQLIQSHIEQGFQILHQSSMASNATRGLVFYMIMLDMESKKWQEFGAACCSSKRPRTVYA